ncbi:MAG: hypothetical protein WCW66_01085 [Patescibacteria group bacterium]
MLEKSTQEKEQKRIVKKISGFTILGIFLTVGSLPVWFGGNMVGYLLRFEEWYAFNIFNYFAFVMLLVGVYFLIKANQKSQQKNIPTNSTKYAFIAASFCLLIIFLTIVFPSLNTIIKKNITPLSTFVLDDGSFISVREYREYSKKLIGILPGNNLNEDRVDVVRARVVNSKYEFIWENVYLRKSTQGLSVTPGTAIEGANIMEEISNRIPNVLHLDNYDGKTIRKCSDGSIQIAWEKTSRDSSPINDAHIDIDTGKTVAFQNVAFPHLEFEQPLCDETIPESIWQDMSHCLGNSQIETLSGKECSEAVFKTLQ